MQTQRTLNASLQERRNTYRSTHPLGDSPSSQEAIIDLATRTRKTDKYRHYPFDDAATWGTQKGLPCTHLAVVLIDWESPTGYRKTALPGGGENPLCKFKPLAARMLRSDGKKLTSVLFTKPVSPLILDAFAIWWNKLPEVKVLAMEIPLAADQLLRPLNAEEVVAGPYFIAPPPNDRGQYYLVRHDGNERQAHDRTSTELMSHPRLLAGYTQTKIDFAHVKEEPRLRGRPKKRPASSDLDDGC